MRATHESNKQVSPITDSCRAEFLRQVRTLYEEWIGDGIRFERGEDDEDTEWAEGFQPSSIVGTPTPVEWLSEYIGEREANVIRGIGWHYPTFSDIVYDRAGEITRDAFKNQHGSKWHEDDELIEAQDADWSRLNSWVEEELSRCNWTTPATDEQQPRQEGN